MFQMLTWALGVPTELICARVSPARRSTTHINSRREAIGPKPLPLCLNSSKTGRRAIWGAFHMSSELIHTKKLIFTISIQKNIPDTRHSF
jgi:hypothetical protein